MPFISTRDNTKLYIDDRGTGRSVLLLHGWCMSSASWDAVAGILAEQNCRVVAPDRRGFGRSEVGAVGGDVYDVLVDDLANVINALELRDVTLVGFSMGGGEVVRFLNRHGSHNVKRIALISAVVPSLLQTPANPEGVPADELATLADGVSRNPAGFYKAFFRAVYRGGEDTARVDNAALEQTLAVAMQADVNMAKLCAEALANTDFGPELGKMKVPALIIHGSHDAVVPINATARKAVAAIPGSRLIEYAGASHGLPVTHAGQLARDLMAFIDAPV